MADDLIERVARIIDPSAWAVMDNYLEQTKRKYAGQNVGWPTEQFQDKRSMAKAREILAAIQPSEPEVQAMVERKFWLGLQEPGRVPERKGPWPRNQMAKILREFIKARPTAYIYVLTIDYNGHPEIEHGPEALQMLDGRSMGTGSKHNDRTKRAHAEHHANLSASRADAFEEGRKFCIDWLRTEQGKGSDAGIDYAEGFADQLEQMVIRQHAKGEKQ